MKLKEAFESKSFISKIEVFLTNFIEFFWKKLLKACIETFKV
jgi:hypothetical protein